MLDIPRVLVVVLVLKAAVAAAKALLLRYLCTRMTAATSTAQPTQTPIIIPADRCPLPRTLGQPDAFVVVNVAVAVAVAVLVPVATDALVMSDVDTPGSGLCGSGVAATTGTVKDATRPDAIGSPRGNCDVVVVGDDGTRARASSDRGEADVMLKRVRRSRAIMKVTSLGAEVGVIAAMIC